MNEKLRVLEKYNFWNGNVQQLGYLRTSYTDAILDYSNNKLIKVVVGQRRAGKSYGRVHLPQNQGIKHVQAWRLFEFLNR